MSLLILRMSRCDCLVDGGFTWWREQTSSPVASSPYFVLLLVSFYLKVSLGIPSCGFGASHVTAGEAARMLRGGDGSVLPARPGEGMWPAGHCRPGCVLPPPGSRLAERPARGLHAPGDASHPALQGPSRALGQQVAGKCLCSRNRPL